MTDRVIKNNGMVRGERREDREYLVFIEVAEAARKINTPYLRE